MIAIIVPLLGDGGAERQISLIAPLLLQRTQKEIIIISMISPVSYIKDLNSQGVRVLTLNMTKGHYSLIPFLNLIKIIKAQNIQQLITFNYPANFIGRIIKLLFPRIRLITSVRSSTFGSTFREKIISISRFLDYKTVINSYNTANSFRNKGVISPDRLKVICNGIEVPDIKVVTQQILNGQSIRCSINSDFVWIAVGRFEKPKDYPNLLHALKLLESLYKGNWKLIVIGDGTLRVGLQKTINELDLNGRIILVGKKENVFDFYHAADAFVSASAWEGMPNALIEAMLSGLAVVSTNVGEVSRLVSPLNGIIVPPKNSEALADAMRQIMELDSGKRKEMGISSNTFIKDNFDIQNIIQDWIEVLE